MVTPGLLFTDPDSPKGRECARKLEIELDRLASERGSRPTPPRSTVAPSGTPDAGTRSGSQLSTETDKVSDRRLRVIEPTGAA